MSKHKSESRAPAALPSCEPKRAGATGNTARAGAGMPVAPLLGTIDEASFWADIASATELKAYCVACYQRLSPDDRRAFLEWAQKGARRGKPV